MSSAAAPLRPSSREVGRRRALLVLAAAAALVAVAAGLARIGFEWRLGVLHAGAHGPLFVLGLFGTVITLERAVALGRPAALLAPGLSAAGAVLQLLGQDSGRSVSVAAAGALVILNLALARRQWASFTALMLLGAGVLLGGNLAWALGLPVPRVTQAWMAFFALTIVAERLELSRLAPTPAWARHLVLGLGIAHAAAAVAALAGAPPALTAFAATALALGLWQLRFDVAWRTARQPGLPRFAASGILSGAVWLALSGLFSLLAPVPAAGPRHDAALHGVFVGYVLSMVFAHAPIILPAVAKIAVPFHPILYGPLVLLHGGLAVRVVGDLSGLAAVRRTGGLLNALALLGFVVSVLYARRARRRRRASGAADPA